MLGSVVKKGMGGLGGALMGGAGLIAGGLISSTGAGKYVAGAAAIGAGAMKFSSGGGSNTIAEKNLSSKSAPSEVEEAEVTILDKILKETGILAEVVEGQKIPESTKRELQLDKDKWHKKLINAFKSIKFSDGDKEKKKSWLDTLKNIFKALPIGLRQILKGGAFVAAYKMAKGFIKALGRFALRMLLVFASPAMIAVVAAFLIMTNWKAIKLRIRRTMYGIKKWLKDKLSYIGMGDLVTLGQNPDTAMDADEFADTPTTSSDTTQTPILVPERSNEEYVPPGGMDEDGNLYIDNERPPEEYVPPEGIAEPTLDAFGGEGVEIIAAPTLNAFGGEGELMPTFDEKYNLGDDELQSMMSDEQIKNQWSGREIQTQTIMSRVIARGYAEDDEFNQLNALLRLGHGLDTYDVNKLSPSFYDAINEGNMGRMDRNLISAFVHKRDPRDELEEYLDKNPGREVNQSGELKNPTSKSSGSYNQGQQYKKPKKEKELGQLTGLMGTHLHTAPKSTGLGWLDKLYQKDADMRYEKAFMKATKKSNDPWLTEEPKLVPKVVVLNNETNTSKTMKKSSTSTKVMTPGFSVTNSSSVAVESAK